MGGIVRAVQTREMGVAGTTPIPLSGSVTRIDLEALAIFSRSYLTLYRRERAEPAKRTAKLVAAHMIERPHVLGLEAQVRLCDQGLTVGSDEPEILDRISDIPAVITVLPLAATAEAAHCRRGAAFILGSKRHLVGPAATFRAVGVDLAVNFVADKV